VAQPTLVHVVVLRPAGSAVESPVVAALARLGSEVGVDAVASAHEAGARTLEGDVDLLVVDADAAPAEAEALLARVRDAGPPVVVVLAGGDDDAVDWFRRGAADCVAASHAEEALPVAALDLIRRHRASRERQSAERRIASLRSYTKHIIQNIHSALLVVDRACRITYANRPAEELLGERPGSLVGQEATRWFAGASAADQPLLRTLEKGERFRGAEVLLARADGERVPAAVYCGPMRDEEGRELGAVAILQDLSEMRRLQRQLFQSEKMASIGQLAAGVAHEINNPAGFIDANLFQMEEYVGDLRRLWRRAKALESAARSALAGIDAAAPEAAPAGAEALRAELAALRAEAEDVDADFVLEDLGKAIRESREGSERIRHIVQDLRTFARPDARERVWADVNQCVDSTANIVWSLMKHAVELDKRYGELPALLCHPGQLKQVFMNLLMNAYQAVAARVGDTGELGRIAIDTGVEAADVVVSIRDEGIGMSPDALARAFDPFYTTREVGSGTGLGLSTAFHLVSAHGGRIEAESREGEGSTFRVVLPASPPTPPGGPR
jgi:PAS domain S-box-containing protein